ncbi:hypothetical protein [Propionivibrio sp.]|uniref:hypothetical protein n=1 Tax=Propionivibrio sp. TaxID=2212460 RepID=UPI0025EA86E4|nr:hypothetical protein [Propionivibrio sp.]
MYAAGPAHGGPLGVGRRCSGKITPDTRNWPIPQCGQRAGSMRATRRRKSATDSITADCGGGTSSATRAAASPRFFLAGDEFVVLLEGLGERSLEAAELVHLICEKCCRP